MFQRLESCRRAEELGGVAAAIARFTALAGHLSFVGCSSVPAGSSFGSGVASGITLHAERAFSLVNGSLAVDVDGSGRIDVVTPTHRLQFLVEVKSELSHDKWLKVLAQSIAVYDSESKYFIDFGEMVPRARAELNARVSFLVLKMLVLQSLLLMVPI